MPRIIPQARRWSPNVSATTTTNYTAADQPPGFDELELTPDWDLIARPDAGFEFDQRLTW